MTKALRAKLEREKREAAWRAEQERVWKLGEIFEAVPDCPSKAALLQAMTDRIVHLYNQTKFEEGDAILEFLPNNYAKQLLDWYFDDDEKAPYPTQATAGQNGCAQWRQVQDQSQADCWPYWWLPA